VAVVAFYKALHWIEAMSYCDHACKHGGNHSDREQVLKWTALYQNIYKHYRPLYAASCVARYLTHSGQEFSAFATYLSPDPVEAKLVQHHLKQLEKSVEKFIESNQSKPA